MKILIIQTAFIGDVVLATPLIEKLHQFYPDSQIDFLLRKGNEGLLNGHPYVRSIIIWDKKQSKLTNLIRLVKRVRRERYDVVINVHRFASSGLIVYFSKARERIGFDKNPFSFCYTRVIKHDIGQGKHEIERNIALIAPLTDDKKVMPCLYPLALDNETVKGYKINPYICIAPSSVWFTKQYPAHKWVDFIKELDGKLTIYLLGASTDAPLCERIATATSNKRVINLAGKLTFLQTAALMKDAAMNYVNDSAPMHIASSVNAPVTAVFCSTIPAFGFGPLSQKSFIVETPEKLDCRPCGLHGYKTCPKGHFKCAETITTSQLLKVL